MDIGDEILQAILNEATADTIFVRPSAPILAPTPSGAPKTDMEDHSQWALGGNGKFLPVGQTALKLPAGIYEPFATTGGYGLELMHVSSDGIYDLPDMATQTVLQEIQTFWENEAKYREHRLLYKRGVILCGPPGSGKSITVKLLMNALIQRDGVVVICGNVSLAVLCLKAIRRVEPTRNLIVVFEDIDEIINYNGEATVLSMLDGENNIDRVLNIATTNYPERLGARIINRPSRFDRRVYIGMPGCDARRVYLQQTTHNGLVPEQLEQWVADTGGMSIAHLRELVAAVYCLDQPYGDVLERLRAMATQPKGDEGFANKKMGFVKTVTRATSLPSGDY